ncbi:ATP-binding protein [Streptomyces prasinopilosus]|uniref:ATPase family associated with various cellular activities (AAA) n=1 Tax=Streptomyces prasinopilosus TaxID=67344 RepID=A0A1G6VL86_9ACTN|nr:ATP-binding protein [Streptomyces prasinopilosus]SDD53665.1 ATPase family associated with various cellular activities (AAA) [Streptomyces prasinopilosus]
MSGYDHDPAEALLERVARLRERVALLVEHRAAGDPTADDPLRGLYLSEEAVRHHLRAPAPPAPAGDSGDGGPGGGDGLVPGDRLGPLARRLGLHPLEAEVLLVALAPDLDRSFEPLYGYLNDDVGRRRATVGVALDLCGAPVHRPEVRAVFRSSAPLRSLALLGVDEPERPFLSRSLRVPGRLLAHLLGDDTPDPALAGRVRPLAVPAAADAPGDDTFAGRLAARLAAAPLTVYLREHRDGEGLVHAARALPGALHYTPQGPHAEEPLGALLREARLRDRAVVVSPLPDDPGALVRALSVPDVPVVFTGSRPYDPEWCDHDPLVLDAPRLGAGAVSTWSAALDEGAGPDGRTGTPAGPADSADPSAGPAPLGFDLAATVAPYHLSADRVLRAARAARGLAAFDGTALTPGHLRLAARQQSASGLERHARRIRPAVDWGDLVLPETPLTQLRELAQRARNRDRVLGDWRLSAGGGRGRGVLGLFAGESGTGKTLSAEVVAAELGLDMYVVRLSSVVDKYVGETEKNLERIFSEADRTDAVLLFDEADAVFGKRSEVKDAHDRYANMESAYLLQRLESFDGIALLTTNLRANIDEAFTRRLDLVVDFPFPDAGQRLALWRHSLSHVPCADDIDPQRVARDFELAGGSIRSAVVTAAYAAADRDGPVTTADLLEGARREYRKAGRLVPGEGTW